MSEATDQSHRGGLDDRGGRTTPRRPASVVEATARHAKRVPEKLCLRFEGEEWTYNRVNRRVEDAAAALRTWELRAGEVLKQEVRDRLIEPEE